MHYQKCKSEVSFTRNCVYYNSGKVATAAKFLKRAKTHKHSKANAKKNM